MTTQVEADGLPDVVPTTVPEVVTTPVAAQAAPTTMPPRSVPESALADIKRRQREAGQRQATAALLKTLGAATVEELQAKLNPQTARKTPDDEIKALRKENADLKKQLAESQNLAGRWERAAKKRAQQLVDKDTEFTLHAEAARAGFEDPEVGVVLLQRHLRGKTAEQLKDFDSAIWFAGVLKAKPALAVAHVAALPVTEIVQDASTGVGGAKTDTGAAVTKPAPVVAPLANTEPKLDARKAPRDQVIRHLGQSGVAFPE